MLKQRRNLETKSAYVRQAPKQVHYTITPIGGKAELSQWKLAQVKKEEEYQIVKSEKYAKTRLDVIANLLVGHRPPLTDLETAEIAYVRSLGAAPKQPKSRPKSRPEYIPYIDPPKSLYSKVKTKLYSVISNIWKSAFDNS